MGNDVNDIPWWAIPPEYGPTLHPNHPDFD